VNELERKIADRIKREGPLPFSTFMEMALYDDVHGYYRGDPFGRDGDFFTASQLQPVFGAYVAALAQRLDAGFEKLIDIGAGRGEVGEGFAEGKYASVRKGEKIFKTNHAILFSNELIDALPVDVVGRDGEMLKVDWNGERLVWHPHEPREGAREVRPGVRAHLEEAYEAIDQGSYVLIDYGYHEGEHLRFPMGTLMSYRRHTASDEVLREPGKRDITAHVDWAVLLREAKDVGWTVRSIETLRGSLLSLGEDKLASLTLLGEMQLKTLLFGLGESFDVVVLDKK